MEGGQYSTFCNSTTIYTAILNFADNLFNGLAIPTKYSNIFRDATSNLKSKLISYYTKGSLLTYGAMVMDPRHKCSDNLLNEDDNSFMLSLYFLFILPRLKEYYELNY